MTATVHPAARTRIAAVIAAVPAPITISSYCFVISALRKLVGCFEALSSKTSDRFLSANELAREIDIHDFLPILQGHFREGGVLLQARVGNDDVNPA